MTVTSTYMLHLPWLTWQAYSQREPHSRTLVYYMGILFFFVCIWVSFVFMNGLAGRIKLFCGLYIRPRSQTFPIPANTTKRTRCGDKSRKFISPEIFYSVIQYDTIFCYVLARCCLRVHGRSSQQRCDSFFSFFFAGKILNDDTALKEYKIDEKNFVVVMVTKVWQ